MHDSSHSMQPHNVFICMQTIPISAENRADIIYVLSWAFLLTWINRFVLNTGFSKTAKVKGKAVEDKLHEDREENDNLL